MRKNENAPSDMHDAIKWDKSLDANEHGVGAKIGRKLIRLIYIASLAAIAFIFYACTGSYVATEPTYTENVRPQAPSNLHVWINGEWTWNRQTQGYVQRDGYWSKPSRNRTYVAGHWRVSPRGHVWIPGHWQRRSR